MLERNRRQDRPFYAVFLCLYMLSSAAADEPADTAALADPSALSPQKVAESAPLRDFPATHRDHWSPVPQRHGPTFGDVEFRDGSTLGRLKSIREVSFITVAEFRQSRFFFGMSTDGIVGFHLVSRPTRRQDRFIEILHTPWIDRKALPAEPP